MYWGIDFMGPFVSFFNNLYILPAMDYVPKWVEAIFVPTNDTKVMLKKNIFSRFKIPRTIISNEECHFCNRQFEALLSKYGVKHKIYCITTSNRLDKSV